MSERCDAFFQYGPARSANSKVHWLVTIPFGEKDCASWISAVRLHVMCLLTRGGGWLEKRRRNQGGVLSLCLYEFPCHYCGASTGLICFCC